MLYCFYLIYGGEDLSSRILLVEDDVFLREGLCEMLTGQGYAVTVAETSAKANEHISGHYDLMIFDIMLPDGNGLDLCRKARSIGSTVPILFLTIMLQGRLDCLSFFPVCVHCYAKAQVLYIQAAMFPLTLKQ